MEGLKAIYSDFAALYSGDVGVGFWKVRAQNFSLLRVGEAFGHALEIKVTKYGNFHSIRLSRRNLH